MLLQEISIMKKLFYFLLLSSICLAASCIKFEEEAPPEPTLPALTTEGLNTFGCYINGELWVAETPLFSEIAGIRRLEAFYHPILVNPPREHYFAIRAKKTNEDGSLDQTIIIEIENVQDEGTFEIIYSDKFYRDINYSCSEKFFELDTISFNEVRLTRFDTLAKIASGTFSFTLINQECNETLKITEGRFDTSFKP